MDSELITSGDIAKMIGSSNRNWALTRQRNDPTFPRAVVFGITSKARSKWALEEITVWLNNYQQRSTPRDFSTLCNQTAVEFMRGKFAPACVRKQYQLKKNLAFMSGATSQHINIKELL